MQLSRVVGFFCALIMVPGMTACDRLDPEEPTPSEGVSEPELVAADTDEVSLLEAFEGIQAEIAAHGEVDGELAYEFATVEDTLLALEEEYIKSPRFRAGNGNRAGVLSMDLELLAGGRELVIREQSMCDGWAKTWFYYNRNLGKVVQITYFDGLPYRPTFAYDYNPSTPYNTYPDMVEDGRWQQWVVGRFLTVTSTFWYDSASLDLIGNEFELPGPPPVDAIPVDIPVLQMVCTPLFDPDPYTLKKINVNVWDYHQMIDAAGRGGTYATSVPTNLGPDGLISPYYIEGGLPVEMAMDWDDVLDDIEAGEIDPNLGNLGIATSVEPDPKPPELVSIDNLMIGWGNVLWPNEALGVPPDFSEYGECGTFQLPDPYPGL